MIYNHAGNVEVDVDVDGYYTAAGGSGSAFVAIDPVRLVDTRARLGGSPLAPKSSESFPLTNASIPADATAVATNVTSSQVEPLGTSRSTHLPCPACQWPLISTGQQVRRSRTSRPQIGRRRA